MKFLFIPLLILFAVSCNKSGGGAFENLEDEPTEINDPTIDGVIVISSVTPSLDPVTLVAGLNTFAVQINAGAGDSVTYDFRFDGISVQNSTAPFYVLTGAGVIAGGHTLEVIVENSTYSDSHTFNLFKNTPPVIALVSTNPATPAIISCLGGTFIMNTSATDVDADAMTFTYYLNGANGSTALANTSTASTGSTTFTPTCAMIGIANLKIRATDTSGEFDEEIISVTVSNPTQASITGFSPVANPVIIESTASQQFIISPDGTAPYGIVWTLTPGGVIPACANQTSCTFNGGGAYVGSYTLNVELTDANTTSDDMDFSLIFNAPPEFTSSSYILTKSGTAQASSTLSPLDFSCSDSIQFSVNLNDQNFGDAGQTHSLIWSYGGTAITNSSGVLITGTAIDQMFTVTTNVASTPMTSVLTFRPNCDAQSLNGVKEIKVIVSDGLEDVEDSWDMNASLFSDECINMTSSPGVPKICTLAGIPGLANDIEVGSNLIGTANANPHLHKVRVRPHFMEEYVSGTDRGFFISDTYHHVIWFYNHNLTGDITVLGKTIGPKKIRALLGAGAPGYGVENRTYNSFYLNAPHGIAWDSTNSALFVSDYQNSRIVKFSGAGLGNAYTLSTGTSDTTGHLNISNPFVAATSQRCLNPAGMEVSGGKLYVACFGNSVAAQGAIKAFDLTTNVGTIITRQNTTNTVGVFGTAITNRPWAMAKHPNQELIFFSTWSSAAIGVINNTGSPYANANNITTSVASGSTGFITPGGGANLPGAITPTAGTQIGIAYNNANFRMQDAVNLQVKMDSATGLVLQGLFMTQDDGHYVAFLNLSGSSVTVGNRAVAAGVYDRVWGTGVQGTTHLGAGYTSTQFNLPRAMAVLTNSAGLPTNLFTGEIYGFKIASLDISTGNGSVGTLLGTQAPYGYDGEVDLPATQHRLNGPTALSYDSVTNRLYFADSLNFRIRYVDLNTGRIRTALGNNTNSLNTNNGTGNANATTTTSSLSSNLKLVRGLSVAENISSVFYTDVAHDSGGAENAATRLTPNTNSGMLNFMAYQGAGTARQCHLRMFNADTVDHNVMNTLVSAGSVFSFAGITANGCSAWNTGIYSVVNFSNMIEGQQPNSFPLAAPVTGFGSEPFGVIAIPDTFGGSNYSALVAMRGNHCIARINSSGNFASEVGLCNGFTANSGNTDGALLSARLQSPGSIALDGDPTYAADGNFFIVDNSLATTSGRIKYVNHHLDSDGAGSDTDDVDIFNDGTNVVPTGQVTALTNVNLTSIPFAWGVAANDRMLCVSQGATSPATTVSTVYAHNIVCIDRDGSLDIQIGQLQGGPTSAWVRSSVQLGSADEGSTASALTKISHPMGMVFDNDGNLYYSDYGSHTIKMVKKWW
jgi:hypothetical protein